MVDLKVGELRDWTDGLVSQVRDISTAAVLTRLLAAGHC